MSTADPYFDGGPVGTSRNASTLSTRISGGIPSTRSAMMFLRISSVPPAIRIPGDLKPTVADLKAAKEINKAALDRFRGVDKGGFMGVLRHLGTHGLVYLNQLAGNVPTRNFAEAAVEFDDTGSTRIGKYVFDHPFIIPGTLTITLSVILAFIIGPLVI